MTVDIGKVAVIGLGLIGGSFAAASRASGVVSHVAGYAPGSDGDVALALGHVDSVSGSIEEAVTGADLVVVATPVTVVDAVFAAVCPALPSHTIVTDCASTKLTVVASARRHLGSAFDRYVPGHPIAGSERSGPAAARADLFRGRPWLFCPVNDAQRMHLSMLQALVERFGARADVIDAGQHDAVFAEYSHAPHAIVFALCLAVARGPWSGKLTELAGAGLRDTTRIGASSPALWADILLDNAANSERSMARFDDALGQIRAAVQAGDREQLMRLFDQASGWRAALPALPAAPAAGLASRPEIDPESAQRD